MNRYLPPRLVEGRDAWYIVWYTFDTLSNCYRRHRRTFNLNRIKSLRERRALARSLIRDIGQKVKRGQPVFDEPDQSLGSTPISQAIQMACRVKCASARPATITTYESQTRIFLQYLEAVNQIEVPVGLWDRSYAIQFMDAMRERGISGTTYNNYITVYRALFGLLVDRAYLLANPFSRLPRAKTDRKRRRIFSDRQAQIMASAARANDPWLYLGILLQYHCFIRPTELRRLRIQDIDFSGGVIRLHGSQTKNRKSDVVTIPDQVLPELDRLLSGIPGQHYLFGKTGRPSAIGPAGKNTMNARHKSLLKKVSAGGNFGPIEGLTYYSWKDTGATALVRAGIPISEVMKQLRHSSLQTTQTYIDTLHQVNEKIKAMPSILFGDSL